MLNFACYKRWTDIVNMMLEMAQEVKINLKSKEMN